jgi:hypothetical protein
VEVAVKKLIYAVAVMCLALALLTSVALAATAKKPPAPAFPANAKITVTSVPPFFYIVSWTAATGKFDAYRLDLVKATGSSGARTFNAGLATRYTLETVQGEGYPYVAAGDYKVTVNAMAGGKVAASLALKGTVRLK